MCHEVDEIRILAIQCFHCFWINVSPANKFAAGINEYTLDESSGIAEFILYNPVTIPVYQSLMDFALGLKVIILYSIHIYNKKCIYSLILFIYSLIQLVKELLMVIVLFLFNIHLL